MTTAPQLVEPFSIGAATAAEILLVTAVNPERIRSEVALAKLARISTFPAPSGMSTGATGSTTVDTASPMPQSSAL